MFPKNDGQTRRRLEYDTARTRDGVRGRDRCEAWAGSVQFPRGQVRESLVGPAASGCRVRSRGAYRGRAGPARPAAAGPPPVHRV